MLSILAMRVCLISPENVKRYYNTLSIVRVGPGVYCPYFWCTVSSFNFPKLYSFGLYIEVEAYPFVLFSSFFLYPISQTTSRVRLALSSHVNIFDLPIVHVSLGFFLRLHI